MDFNEESSCLKLVSRKKRVNNLTKTLKMRDNRMMLSLDAFNAQDMATIKKCPTGKT